MNLHHVQRNSRLYAISIAILLGFTFLTATQLLVPLVVKGFVQAEVAAEAQHR